MPKAASAVEITDFRPTWAEVSLANLRQNFRVVQEFVAPRCAVCAVVKAHAYGHGAVECARALELEGAKWFGVTSTDEGIALRGGGITNRVLLLTGFWRGDEEAVLEHDLTPAIWDREHIERLEKAAAKLKKDSISVHLKVDTGMARLGANPADLPLLAKALKSARRLELEGVFTHFASAEVVDSPEVDAQITRFDKVVDMLLKAGLPPVYYHMANSSAIACRPQTWRNMVRPGIALYGYYLPFHSILTGKPDTSYELPVKPVLSWKTRVFSLRDVGADQPIGYSGSYVTQAPARIAALPVGYADGLSRQLSSRGRVIVRDQYAPIVGNISMDITLIDVTNIPGAQVGDGVVILGETKRCSVTAWDHAGIAATIPYEILCNISKRVPRKYVG